MDLRFTDGYLEEEAQVRFSDFTENGRLQYSRCLMYFERSRFKVAEISGIIEVLRNDFEGTSPAFVVTRADIHYLRSVRINEDGLTRKIIVRTKLILPVVSKIAFLQQLVDELTGQVMIEAKIDTVVLIDNKMLMKYPENVLECLEHYVKISEDQE